MKYNIIICAILKDETPYLVEWAEHHLGIGVEHFVLYDNNSVIPAKQTLEAYVRKGIVEVIDCPITNTPQLKAYTHCLYNMHGRTKWIAYIDLDEFIILKKHRDIHAFLADYDEYAGVCMNWVIHTANGHIEKPEGPVMQNYTEPLPDDFPANRHVKSIVRPDYVNTVDSSHYPRYDEEYYAVNEKFRYVPQAFCDFSNETIQLNHYFTKSFEEWLGKIGKGISDTLHTRAVEEFWEYNPGMLPRKDEIELKYKETIDTYNRFRVARESNY